MTSKISVLVTSSPVDHPGPDAAIRYCEAVIATQGQIDHVFFYQSGVHNANSLVPIGSEPQQILQRWKALSQEHGVALYVCHTAAAKRGIVGELEAKENDLPHVSLLPPFEQVGLGTFFERLHECQRLVQF